MDATCEPVRQRAIVISKQAAIVARTNDRCDAPALLGMSMVLFQPGQMPVCKRIPVRMALVVPSRNLALPEMPFMMRFTGNGPYAGASPSGLLRSHSCVRVCVCVSV